MPQLFDFAKKVWSWLDPVPVQVRFITSMLPSGQLELRPEYTIGGKLVDPSLFKADSRLSDGYRFRISSDVQEVLAEFQGETHRVRPRAAQKWMAEKAKRGLPVIDAGTGRRINTFVPDIEYELDLKPDKTVSAVGFLSRPDGVEIDHQKVEPVPGEPGWYKAEESLFERPQLSEQLNQILDSAEKGRAFQGDAIPSLLAELDDHNKYIHGVRKTGGLEDLRVFHREPKDTFRVHSGKVSGHDSDAIVLDQSITYSSVDGQSQEVGLAEVDALLADADADADVATFKPIANGWVKVRRSDRERARSANSALHLAANGQAIKGESIPELLSGLAEHVRRGSPWNVQIAQGVLGEHALIEEEASLRFKLGVVHVEGSERLLHLEPLYEHRKHQLSHQEIAEAVGRKTNWVRRPHCWVRVDKAKFIAVERAAKENDLKSRNSGFTFEAGNREQVLEAFNRIGKVEQTESYAQFLRNLLEFHGIERVEPPHGLDAGYGFRAYQQHGYDWLVFLRRFGLNGVLADDMGLGKTLQTLSAIRHSKEVKARGAQHPSLVICPVSLMANWEAEAKRFFPGTKVTAYRGSDRKRLAQGLYWCDLVITSFTIAANDSDQLNRIPWNYVVIDEAHAIKNPTIKRSQKIKEISGTHKLALTGTPIQNSVTDLWSLFDCVMPGYLGTLTAFRSQYPMLFDKRRTDFAGQATELQERVRPFVLRRLKKDVASELPDKIIIDRVYEISPEQRQLYKQLLEGRDVRELKESIATGSYGNRSMSILSTLAKLRNVCNHPVLETNGAAWKIDESAKLEALEDMFNEIIDGGHRVLLFSQFTKVLDLIEPCLGGWKVKFLRIDGATPPAQRQPIVDQFNRDESCHCMLLSTRAGGVGLNLTGADTVIFYDHDWNPAMDQQAQDRAHRIGQTRKVTVYRLITRGTIEEKMLRYQERKKALSQALISVDEQGMKNLSREELLSLFSFEESEATVH